MNLLLEMLEMLTGAYIRSDRREIQRGNQPKTWIGRLFATFAWGMEIVNETARIVKLWENLDYAAGTVLDRYGDTYGVKREGTDDDFYRVMIKVKMIAQVSGGDTDTVIRAASSLYDVDPERLEVEEIFPAKGRVHVDIEAITPEKRKQTAIISRLLKRIVACGVGIDVIYHLFEDLEGTIFVGSFHSTQIEENASGKPERETELDGTIYVGSSHTHMVMDNCGINVPVEEDVECTILASFTASCFILEEGGIPDNA